GSVDRLDQIPARLSTVFHFDAARALADARVRDEMTSEPARQVVRALADALAGAPRLGPETFRQIPHQGKASTGQKGRQLFHPIRVALTGLPEGPELDLVIPAIDRGADLPADSGIPAIVGCRERASALAQALDGLEVN